MQFSGDLQTSRAGGRRCNMAGNCKASGLTQIATGPVDTAIWRGASRCIVPVSRAMALCALLCALWHVSSVPHGQVSLYLRVKAVVPKDRRPVELYPHPSPKVPHRPFPLGLGAKNHCTCPPLYMADAHIQGLLSKRPKAHCPIDTGPNAAQTRGTKPRNCCAQDLRPHNGGHGGTPQTAQH